MTRHTADQPKMYAIAAGLSAQYRILEGAERRVSPFGNTGHSACDLGMAAKSQIGPFKGGRHRTSSQGRRIADRFLLREGEKLALGCG